jgi:hypothetical protein
MLGSVLLRFQGRRWPCSGGIVGRGGRSRVALPRRPRAALPRAHLLPGRLHQARAAARLPHLHRPRLHRRHWRPRRHGVSSIMSYYYQLLLPIAGSLDHIIRCGYLEAVMERNASPLHSCRGCFVIPNSSFAPLQISASSGI